MGRQDPSFEKAKNPYHRPPLKTSNYNQAGLIKRPPLGGTSLPPPSSSSSSLLHHPTIHEKQEVDSRINRLRASSGNDQPQKSKKVVSFSPPSASLRKKKKDETFGVVPQSSTGSGLVNQSAGEQKQPLRASAQELFKGRPLFNKAVINAANANSRTPLSNSYTNPRFKDLSSSYDISARQNSLNAGPPSTNTSLLLRKVDPAETSNIHNNSEEKNRFSRQEPPRQSRLLRDFDEPLESKRKLKELIKEKDHTIRELTANFDSQMESSRDNIRQKEGLIYDLRRKLQESQRNTAALRSSNAESYSLFEREKDNRMKRLQERVQHQLAANERLDLENRELFQTNEKKDANLKRSRQEYADLQDEFKNLQERYDLKFRENRLENEQLNNKLLDRYNYIKQIEAQNEVLQKQKQKARAQISTLQSTIRGLRFQNTEILKQMQNRPSVKQNKQQARQIIELQSTIDQIYKNPKLVERFTKDQLKKIHRGDKLIDVTNKIAGPRQHNKNIKFNLVDGPSSAKMHNLIQDIKVCLQVRHETQIIPRIYDIQNNNQKNNNHSLSLIKSLSKLIIQCSPENKFQTDAPTTKEIWRWVRNLMSKYMECQKQQKPQFIHKIETIMNIQQGSNIQQNMKNFKAELDEQRKIICEAKQHFHLAPTATNTELRLVFQN